DLGEPLPVLALVSLQQHSAPGHVISRLYSAMQEARRYGLRDNAKCSRCSEDEAGFLHAAWACPGIQLSWQADLQELGFITEVSVEPNPMLALIGGFWELGAAPVEYRQEKQKNDKVNRWILGTRAAPVEYRQEKQKNAKLTTIVQDSEDHYVSCLEVFPTYDA
ncbi:hypothetical protein NDU88_005361, partial [Pleurodeles waltl]